METTFEEMGYASFDKIIPRPYINTLRPTIKKKVDVSITIRPFEVLASVSFQDGQALISLWPYVRTTALNLPKTNRSPTNPLIELFEIMMLSSERYRRSVDGRITRNLALQLI